MRQATLGVEYADDVVQRAGNRLLLTRKVFNGPAESICRETAKLLSEGNVFGWFQGRSEFGPRALGNRSILADPRRAETKNKLNKRVKFRQAFRPFAPIVPYERATNIFVGEDESPFMLRAKHVRPEWRDRIPAVVHVDGTARVQTVRREHNERIYNLLMEFEKLTGVPVLVNTSFNIRGEPIVETPQDAMNCFIYTGIDYLALHDTLVAKNVLYKIFSPFIKVYYELMARSPRRDRLNRALVDEPHNGRADGPKTVTFMKRRHPVYECRMNGRGTGSSSFRNNLGQSGVCY